MVSVPLQSDKWCQDWNNQTNKKQKQNIIYFKCEMEMITSRLRITVSGEMQESRTKMKILVNWGCWIFLHEVLRNWGKQRSVPSRVSISSERKPCRADEHRKLSADGCAPWTYLSISPQSSFLSLSVPTSKHPPSPPPPLPPLPPSSFLHNIFASTKWTWTHWSFILK